MRKWKIQQRILRMMNIYTEGVQVMTVINNFNILKKKIEGSVTKLEDNEVLIIQLDISKYSTEMLQNLTNMIRRKYNSDNILIIGNNMSFEFMKKDELLRVLYSLLNDKDSISSDISW